MTVGWVTYLKRDFVFDMWSLYILCAIGHASSDKLAATITAFKEKRLAAEVGGTVTTSTSTSTSVQPS